MLNKLINTIKYYKEYILASFLWLCVLGTYNTDTLTFFAKKAPYSFLDILHFARSFLPFLALVVSIVIIIRNKNNILKHLFGPLGLLFLYSVVGFISSLLSKNVGYQVYWATLYITAIIVLYCIAFSNNYEKNLALIIKINWIICAFLTIGLVLFIFLKPGIFSVNTLFDFLSGKRPFEGIGSASIQADFFGMAGTRPTGLGRYAGLISIIMFANIYRQSKKQRIIFSLLFVLFFLILIFSRARTSVIACLVAIILIYFFKSKVKFNSGFILLSVIILLSFTNFYQLFNSYLIGENLLDINKKQQIAKIEKQNIVVPPKENKDVVIQTVIPEKNPVVVENKIIENIENIAIEKAQEVKKNSAITLSGRTTGIFPLTWNLFLRSPIIGNGFQADRVYLDGQHAHNTILQALAQTGLLGTFSFIFGFILAVINLIYIFKRYPNKIILVECIGVFIFFAIRSVTESFAYFGADYLFLVPLFAYLQFFPKDNTGVISFSGIKFNAINIKSVINTFSSWIKNEPQKTHQVVVTGMHGIVTGVGDERFKNILNSADLFLPDGISLVKIAQLYGSNINQRVSGADLMKEVLKFSEQNQIKNYFYGDTNEVLLMLAEKLKKDYPNLKIAGMYSPPFRELSENEENIIIEQINLSTPGILWVALGLPKQEIWIYKNKNKLKVPVVIGVGAAFKFVSGKTKRAPKWLGELGFEWLWRLIFEPKIVAKRVFVDIPKFFIIFLKDLFYV